MNEAILGEVIVALANYQGVAMVKFGNLTPEFHEGIQAYVDGKKVKHTPYQYHTPKWEDWRDGFQFAKAVALVLYLLKDGEKDKEPSSTNIIVKPNDDSV